MNPDVVARICDECNYGSFAGKCVVCGGNGVADAYYCRECTSLEKDRDGCPKIVNLGMAKMDRLDARSAWLLSLSQALFVLDTTTAKSMEGSSMLRVNKRRLLLMESERWSSLNVFEAKPNQQNPQKSFSFARVLKWSVLVYLLALLARWRP